MSPPSTPLTAARRPPAPAEVGARLGEFYERHGRMVLAICRLKVRDPQEAEDATQQTFLSAYASMLAGSEPRDPPAWLATIARNECRTRLRARERAPLALDDNAPAAPDASAEASDREELATILRALSQLSERQRNAVILRSVYGLSYRDVAKALDTSVAGVEALIFRGRRRLSAATRPQIAAAHVLLVLPIALRGDLARLIPGFDTGVAAAGAVGIGGGAAGLGIAGAIGGGAGAGGGVAGLFGAPVAAKIVAAVTAASLGIAAVPTAERPEKPAAVEASVVAARPTPSSAAPAKKAPVPTRRAKRAARSSVADTHPAPARTAGLRKTWTPAPALPAVAVAAMSPAPEVARATAHPAPTEPVVSAPVHHPPADGGGRHRDDSSGKRDESDADDRSGSNDATEAERRDRSGDGATRIDDPDTAQTPDDDADPADD